MKPGCSCRPCPQQGELYLTIPIKKGEKSRLGTKIYEAQINDRENWRERHLKSIFTAYRKSLFFREFFPFLEQLLNAPVTNLGPFNINIITAIATKIGIQPEFTRSANLKNLEGEKDARLVKMCEIKGCSRYLSPQGSAVYLEEESPGGAFAKNHIELYYHNYQHPIYNQLYGEFLPNMSIIDLLFGEGFGKARQIIRSGRKSPIHYLDFRKARGLEGS
ncbi:MAG: WbqC family protein [Desulfobaccales bacterium]|nr:WbqC family protein [Desulfobaccales bacterium]